MFKIAVILAVFGVAVAAPGYLHSAVVPLATSYSSRTDIHSKPIVTYTAPIVKTLVAAPIVKSYVAAPIVKSYVAAPLSHGFGYDDYIGYGGYAGHGLGYGHSHLGYGHDAFGYGSYGHGHY